MFLVLGAKKSNASLSVFACFSASLLEESSDDLSNDEEKIRGALKQRQTAKRRLSAKTTVEAEQEKTGHARPTKKPAALITISRPAMPPAESKFGAPVAAKYKGARLYSSSYKQEFRVVFLGASSKNRSFKWELGRLQAWADALDFVDADTA